MDREVIKMRIRTGIRARRKKGKKKMETSQMGMRRFLPSKYVLQEITIWPGEDLNIWEPIVRTVFINVGPWRIKESLLDGKYSWILKYIYQMRCYALAFEDGKLDKDIFETVMLYTERKIRIIENNLRNSIEEADIPSFHKEALSLFLVHTLDKELVDDFVFSKYLKIYDKHRTKVLELGGN